MTLRFAKNLLNIVQIIVNQKQITAKANKGFILRESAPVLTLQYAVAIGVHLRNASF